MSVISVVLMAETIRRRFGVYLGHEICGNQKHTTHLGESPGLPQSTHHTTRRQSDEGCHSPK